MQYSSGFEAITASLFTSRPSDLEGNTLRQPSLATSLNRSQTPSGITTPAPMLREAGSHPTSVTSASSSPGSIPTPPPSRALVLASSSTIPNAVFAPGEDRAPLAACQHILDDLIDLLRRLSISERSHFLQLLPAPPVPPPTSPTTSVNPADLHAFGDESLGGSMPLELPEANGTLSSVSSQLGSHSESDASTQRREQGRG